MQITYRWPAEGKDPDEVTSVTYGKGPVPRIGELVDIDILINTKTKERARKYSRVRDVKWSVGDRGAAFVTVVLAA